MEVSNILCIFAKEINAYPPLSEYIRLNGFVPLDAWWLFRGISVFIVMEQEIWKPIKGLEGYYEVSNKARIRTVERVVIAKDGRKMTISPKIRKQSLDHHGYLYVKVRKENKHISLRVHRALMESFVPNPHNKPFIDHINTIKTDNRIENLRWVTAKENTQNPITLQRIKNACTKEEIQRQIQVRKDNGTWNGKKVFQYTREGMFVANYDTLSDAVRSLNKSERCVGNISKVLDKQNKTAYGYRWCSNKIEPTK